MRQLLLQSPPLSPPPGGAVAWSYKRQEVQGAGPLRAILLAYEAAIAACGRQELARALEALSLLRGALDFPRGGEMALRLQGLYLYCEEQVRRGRFGESAQILRELYGAWVRCSAGPAGTAGAAR